MFFKPKKLNNKINVQSYMRQCEMERAVKKLKWSTSLLSVRTQMLLEKL